MRLASETREEGRDFKGCLEEENGGGGSYSQGAGGRGGGGLRCCQGWYNFFIGKGECPGGPPDWVSQQIIKLHAESTSMWTINPIQAREIPNSASVSSSPWHTNSPILVSSLLSSPPSSSPRSLRFALFSCYSLPPCNSLVILLVRITLTCGRIFDRKTARTTS